MPEPTRQYLFTEEQVRFAFGALTVAMIVGLTAVLLLISARPEGRFTRVDDGQFRRTLGEANEDLRGYRDLGNGFVQLDIHRAMELVSQRGVAPLQGAAAAGTDQGAPEGEVQGAVDGSAVYGNCAGCHQANGEGVPPSFPPLSGHAADLFEADSDYLAQVVLFGLQGEIVVDETAYDGMMPPWQHFSDEEIAAVLNYVLASWENAGRVEENPYSAETVAEVRSQALTPAQVHERRQELDLQ